MHPVGETPAAVGDPAFTWRGTTAVHGGFRARCGDKHTSRVRGVLKVTVTVAVTIGLESPCVVPCDDVWQV